MIDEEKILCTREFYYGESNGEKIRRPVVGIKKIYSYHKDKGGKLLDTSVGRFYIPMIYDNEDIAWTTCGAVIIKMKKN